MISLAEVEEDINHSKIHSGQEISSYRGELMSLNHETHIKLRDAIEKQTRTTSSILCYLPDKLTHEQIISKLTK